jgi:signal transduction histidine kinase
VIYVFRINQHLRKVQRELQTARDTLEQRVQARTEELETAKDMAEKASHAKSEFLSRMSHELRTPMNAILGFAQLMEYGNNPPLPESHQSNVREILLAGNHLLALINDVLDLATIESGRLQLDMKTLDIRDTLEEVQRIIQPLAECEQISLTLESCKQGECTVVVDSTRLKQVLINLLSNAVKYNHPGGSVTLSCLRNEKDQVLLTIEDTGIGIAKHQLEKIFDPFVRLDSNTHIEGTGIGLSVTKQLVEAMGGMIEVDSQVGKGTRFRITLDAANETTT